MFKYADTEIYQNKTNRRGVVIKCFPSQQMNPGRVSFKARCMSLTTRKAPAILINPPVAANLQV
ncbi:hypothetical protein LXL04_009046 [Taraxacum kok-saghyz]